MKDNDNFIDVRKLKFVSVFLTESEVIKRISITKKDNKINYNLFSNLISNPIGIDEFWEYKGFYIGFEILRERLSFSKNDKPGDFDIIVIPFNEDRIYFERTCAFEVKVVRPTRINPKKAPNSYGIKQTNGLIRDGFPLVGLIHICMTEPLHESEKSIIKYDLAKFDIDNPRNNPDFLKNTIDVKVDHFSSFSAENQMKRLLSKEIPKYVGITTVGLNISGNKAFVASFNHDFNTRYTSGYFNPHKKDTTIEKIKLYFKKNKKEFQIAEI